MQQRTQQAIQSEIASVVECGIQLLGRADRTGHAAASLDVVDIGSVGCQERRAVGDSVRRAGIVSGRVTEQERQVARLA
jgi:CobQ-like glutamine amidotransferase family enzyme